MIRLFQIESHPVYFDRSVIQDDWPSLDNPHPSLILTISRKKSSGYNDFGRTIIRIPSKLISHDDYKRMSN